MTSLTMTLEQEISLKSDKLMFRDTIILGEKIEEGVPANSVEQVEKSLKVDLSEIKFEFSEGRIKKGKLKPYSQEDLLMMCSVQPSTHGTLL